MFLRKFSSVEAAVNFIDDVRDLIEPFLGHFQAHLIVLSLLHQLIIAEEHSEGLARNHIAEPEQQVVCVARYDTFELSLQHHSWNVEHHAEEGREVHDAEDAYNDVLVKQRTHCECDEET